MSTLAKLPIEYSRQFSIQLYWNSHGVLLLRSRKTKENPTRLDILFSDVRWMALPVWFDGIRIEQGTISDLPLPLTPRIESEAHLMSVFRVISGGIVHALLADNAVFVAEDEREGPHDSALLPYFRLQGFGLSFEK
jgi:hypothetical protein